MSEQVDTKSEENGTTKPRNMTPRVPFADVNTLLSAINAAIQGNVDGDTLSDLVLAALDTDLDSAGPTYKVVASMINREVKRAAEAAAKVAAPKPAPPAEAAAKVAAPKPAPPAK